MSSFTDRLAILISADGKGAVREIEQVGDKAEKEFGRATAGTEKFASGAIRAGSVMVGAAAVIGVGLKSTVDSALDSDRAQRLLQNTVSKMPALAGASVDAFNEQATALQKVTVASDEQVTAAQAMLGTFQLTQRQILGITPLVIDFARKFGVDVVDASKQVGKALEGQIGALKRQGVSIDENLFKTDRYAAVLKALREQAGGFARAEGRSFEGQLQILSNQADEFKESVGRGVVGVLSDILPAATGAVQGISSLNEETGNTIGRVAALGTASLGAIGGLLVIAGTVKRVSDAFKDGGIAAGGFGTAIKGIGVATALAGPVYALISALGFLDDSSSQAFGHMAATGGKSTAELTRSFRSVAEDVRNTTLPYVEMARRQGDTRRANELLKQSNDEIKRSFRDLARENIGAADRLLESIRRQPAEWRRLGVSVSQLQPILDGAASAQKRANSDSERSAGLLGEQTKKEQELKGAIEARTNATVSSWSSDLAAQQAKVSLTEAMRDGTVSLDDQSVALNYVNALVQVQGDRYTATSGKAADAATQQDFLRNALALVGAQFPKLLPLVQQYLVTLGGIPPVVHTTVEVDTSRAHQAINGVEVAYDRLKRHMTGTVIS